MSYIEKGNLNTIINNILTGEESDDIIKEEDIMFQLKKQ